MAWDNIFKKNDKKSEIIQEEKISQSQQILAQAISGFGQAALDVSRSLKNQVEDYSKQLDIIGRIINDGLLILDSSGNIIKSNQTAEKMFDYSGEEFLGRAANRLFIHSLGQPPTPEQLFKFLDNKNQITLPLASEKGLFTADVVFGKRKDASLFYVDISVSKFEKSNQEVNYLLLIRDITDKIQNQQKYTDLLTQYGQLYHAINLSEQIGIIVTENKDKDYKTIFANKGFLRITGYSLEEIIGNNCRFLQGEKTEKSQIKKFRKALNNGVPAQLEITNYKKDGTPILMSINLAPIKNKDGIPEYWVAVQDDITEQRKNELKIAEQTELIRTIIDATPNLVFLKDKEGKFTVVNNAVANLFDTSIDDLMERVNSNPEDYKLDSIDKMVLDTGKTINLEENLILSNGEQRMYHTTKRLLIQPDGNRAILGVSVDVTEMKQQEQELAQEKSKLAFILSSIPAMVTIFDVEAQNYEYSNEEFRAHNKKNILGKNNSYFNVETSEKIKQMHDDVKEKGTLTKKEILDLGNGPEKYLCKHQYLNGDNQIIISIYTELPE